MSKDLFGHDKVEEAIERIKMFEPPEGYYGCFSGGKDSCVIKKLCEGRINITWFYSQTTIDPPELIYFIRKYHPDVKWEKPEKPFLIKMVEMGFPTRLNRWCCRLYKENGGHGRICLTGIRAEESRKRAGRKMVEHCFKDESKIFVNPILYWTEQDVWSFLKTTGTPYPNLYDQGFDRLGCILCPNNSRRKQESVRWPGYTKAFKRAFNRLYEDRKTKGSKSVDRWNNGDEMFDWWLNEPDNGDPDQTVMFE